MTVTATRALLAAAAAVLLAAGVAAAANTGTFADPAGDSGTAPDVLGVAVSNDDAGTLTFKITLANRPVAPMQNDEVGLGLDLDQNPDTGSVLYGAEVFIAFEGFQLAFFRSGPLWFDEAPAPPSLVGVYSSGVVTISFKASDLGLAPNAGFNFFVDGHIEPGSTDTAPDIRTFNYQQVAGTAPPDPGADRRAPYDEAIRSTGTHGKTAHLIYFAGDGRGETADTVRIFRGRRVIKTINYALEDTNPFFSYSAAWKVPKKVRGKLRFCVSSRDRAGNKSNTACAPFVVK